MRVWCCFDLGADVVYSPWPECGAIVAHRWMYGSLRFRSFDNVRREREIVAELFIVLFEPRGHVGVYDYLGVQSKVE